MKHRTIAVDLAPSGKKSAGSPNRDRSLAFRELGHEVVLLPPAY